MYAPLQITSAYSLLKNPNTITQIIETAKARHYQAIALTDINVMYGAVEFAKIAEKQGIKPLFGITLQINGLVNQATSFPLVLIAENQIGYQNLMWLSSIKMTMTSSESELTIDKIVDHLSGLNIIFPQQSELLQFIISDYSEIDDYWHNLKILLQKSKVYVGINPMLAPQVQTRIIDFSRQKKVPAIALDDVDYLNPEDMFTTQVLKAIDTNTKLEDISELAKRLGTRILRDYEDVKSMYEQEDTLIEAFQNNEALVERSNVTLSFDQQTTLPHFKLPPQEDTAASYLRHLAEKGLDNRLVNTDSEYLIRLNEELNIISNLGFDDYFLIVWDIVNFAKENHIQLGAGRGSAAGSLVAFALGITDVDPVRFGLLFERFLNSERVQMPDIDIDWPDNKREEILEYLHQKYGQRNFAQIITFGTLAAKQALRDTSRVFGVSQAMMSRISNTIPQGKQGRKVSIAEALQTSNALQHVLSEVKYGELLLRIAQRIEGLPRNYSTHAAGVVLSEEPLVKTLPVQSGTETRLLTQFEKGPVENLGLLKIDILGLSNLTILANAIRYAKKSLPDNFDIRHVPLDDAKTLALYRNGDTNGIFQFESTGIKQVLKQLKPANFEHIVAVNALYRPGPSQHIASFIKRRHGQEQASILDDSLNDILGPTFGIIVYQEQVMLVAEKYAGFTLGEADVLRSAMSKKKINQMATLHDQFISGAKSQKHDVKQAEKIFSYVDEFANYGFNRSHAVAYTKLSFELAYMKAHYPIAFFAAILNANLGSADKVRMYVAEAKSRGIKVCAPNVNGSQRFWSMRMDELQMGLNNIKGVRSDFVTALLTERQENGQFKTIQSFVRRLPEKYRKHDTLANLIYAGALDVFGYNRVELLTALDDLIEASRFGDLILNETKIKKMPEMSLTDQLSYEKSVIGVNLSGHPLEAYADFISQSSISSISQMTEEKQKIKLLILVDAVRKTRTKKGDDMAFLTASDMTGTTSVTIFHQLFARVKDLLKIGNVLQVQGQVDSYNGKLSVVAREIIVAPEQASRNESGVWFLKFDEKHDTPQNRRQLTDILQKYHGNNPVIIHWDKNDENQQLDNNFWMGSETAIIRELALLLGYDNVVFRKSR